MEKHPVALIPITTYDQAAVNAAVLQGVDLLGGIARFVQPEERVLLKPNLLSRALPQKAITTHPAVFSAVCRLLRESGACLCAGVERRVQFSCRGSRYGRR